jgi:hypothetical protein
MKRPARAALCVAVALLMVPALRATTAIELTESDLIQQAAVIVVGQCTSLRSVWLDRDLVTLATIHVAESLKGGGGSEITVVLPGGVDSNRPVPIAMTFPAAPEIQLQESVLLFLVPEDRVSNGFGIVGFSQGKFSVADNPQGVKAASQNLTELNLQGRAGVRHGGAKSIVLDELRQRIHKALAAGSRQ